jgi:hypothetical protein
MTITNYTADGQYPTLIALFLASATQGPTAKDDLIRQCTATDDKHVRATLNTWTDLGLFVEQAEGVSIDHRFAKKRNESLEDFADRLPAFCRQLLLDKRHAQPMWPANGTRTDAGIGISGDFARELAWMLAQDIYSFPVDASAADAASIEAEQTAPGRFIFVNDTRWPGLCFWAHYTGFASRDHRIDPTQAIRSELPGIFSNAKTLSAGDFMRELTQRLPVLDFGTYRVEVEKALNDAVWRRPPKGQLSTSISIALRRLQLDGTLALDSPADAGETYTLSGRDFRTLGNFSRMTLRTSRQ